MATSENPRRHLLLLTSLLVIFILSPFVVPYYYGPTILNIIAAGVLLSATYAVSERRSFLIFGLWLSAFWIVMTFWRSAAPSLSLVLIQHGCLVVVLGC